RYIIVEEIGVPNTHSRTAQFVFRQVYKLANRIIAVSKEVKRIIVKQREAPEWKIDVLYNLVPSPANFTKEDNDEFQWVFVSRLVPRKNAATLIEAFSRLDPEKRGVLH